MPEGHTIHRAASDQFALLGRQKLKVTSPQGRFAEGAAALNGTTLRAIDAYGKHLLYRFPKTTLHVHLGLYGDFYPHPNVDAPPPRPTTRVRLVGKTHTVDLVGPNQCELLDDAAIATLLARLGPDPLRADADPELAWTRIHGSRAAVGQLLMDQSVISGVGNIYRAEVLWLTRVPPALPGRELSRERFDEIWRETVRLMTIGREMDRIVTTDLATITKPIAKLTRAERFNIYKNESCPRCETPIVLTTLPAARFTPARRANQGNPNKNLNRDERVRGPPADSDCGRNVGRRDRNSRGRVERTMNSTMNPVAPELAARIASFFKPSDEAQRARRVSRVRQSVRSESYENELKLSIAIDRLIDEIEHGASRIG